MKSNRDEIKQKLKNFFILEKRKEEINLALSMISFLSFLFLLIVLIEAVGNFNSSVRTILFYLFVAVVLFSLLIFINSFIKNLISIRKINYSEV